MGLLLTTLGRRGGLISATSSQEGVDVPEMQEKLKNNEAELYKLPFYHGFITKMMADELISADGKHK